METIRQIRNDFEIRDKSFRLNTEAQVVTISDCQSWREYRYEMVKEDFDDYENSVIDIKWMEVL